jgi:hypothetical protein
MKPLTARSRVFAAVRGSLLWAAAGITLFGAAGCGGLKLYPVEGRVLVKGQPLNQGYVTLFPDGDGAPAVPGKMNPMAKIEEGGRYRIFSGSAPGAPAGKYRVVVKAMSRRQPLNEAAPAVPPGGPGHSPGARKPRQPTEQFLLGEPLINTKYFHAESTPLRIEVVTAPAKGAYDLEVTR